MTTKSYANYANYADYAKRISRKLVLFVWTF